MKIGIDFDNTIARYDISFKKIAINKKFIKKNCEVKNKSELKNYLYKKINGQKNWMKLQGLVYGKYMYQAQIMPSVINFLKLCKKRKHQLFIISHKTKYGHFDSRKILLREKALKWMENKGFFDQNYIGFNKKNVLFANTRNEKIKIISQLNCNWFIDDLIEVLKDKNFPTKTKKVLFNQSQKNIIDKKLLSFTNWSDICDAILGNLKKNEINFFVDFYKKKQTKIIKQISGHGNSRIYKMKISNNKYCAIKYYPDLLIDSRPRLKTEFQALQFLNKNNVKNIPKTIIKHEDLNIGIYKWISGSRIKNPDEDDLAQAINFIKKLNIISKTNRSKKISIASESCLSAKNLIDQIEKRLRKYNKIKKNYPKLKNFLEKIFIPLWYKVKKNGLGQWPVNSKNKPLAFRKLVLSPSDFGFHNALKKNKKIIFIDFEYFGWDDPVKLTADFLWHPAIILKAEFIKKWEKSMQQIFSNDKDFNIRLKASMPLFGMRWVMIILNEFLPELIEKRNKAIKLNSKKNKFIQNLQLNKAIIYCEKVKNYSNVILSTKK